MTATNTHFVVGRPQEDDGGWRGTETYDAEGLCECGVYPIHPLTGGTNVQTTDIRFAPMRQDDEEGNGEGLTLTERRLLSPEHFRSSDS